MDMKPSAALAAVRENAPRVALKLSFGLEEYVSSRAGPVNPSNRAIYNLTEGSYDTPLRRLPDAARPLSPDSRDRPRQPPQPPRTEGAARSVRPLRRDPSQAQPDLVPQGAPGQTIARWTRPDSNSKIARSLSRFLNGLTGLAGRVGSRAGQARTPGSGSLEAIARVAAVEITFDDILDGGS